MTQPKIVIPEHQDKTKPTPLRLKRWTFAGFLLTYWCNAQCAFCYVYSGPQKKGLVMDVQHALHLWRGLNRIVDEGGPSYGRAGERYCKIHFAGGEPFGEFALMLAIAQAAQRAGLKLFEKVETNAFWAINDKVTREKIQLLKDAGMNMLMISADIYHQEFVPPERCARAARIGQELLGEPGVRVRWWDFLKNHQATQGQLSEAERQTLFAQALVDHRERLSGRAADKLSHLYECHPPEHFAKMNCSEATLGSKHIHVDGAGNVVPGVCSGILWGKVPPSTLIRVEGDGGEGGEGKEKGGGDDEKKGGQEVISGGPWPTHFAGIDDLWRYANDHWPQHPIIGRVVTGGSYQLYEYAKQSGFTPRPEGYASKCHLCHEVRRWLFNRGQFSQVLGPAEVYSENVPHPDTNISPFPLSLPILST